MNFLVEIILSFFILINITFIIFNNIGFITPVYDYYYVDVNFTSYNVITNKTIIENTFEEMEENFLLICENELFKKQECIDINQNNSYICFNSNKNNLKNEYIEYIDINKEYDIIIEAKETCKTRPSILIIYYTYPNAFLNRYIIRNTYGTIKEYSDHTIKVLFFMGKSYKNNTENMLLLEESKTYFDIIQFSYDEKYVNYIFANLLSFKWILDNCIGSSFIIKSEFTVYMNLNVIISNDINKGLSYTAYGNLIENENYFHNSLYVYSIESIDMIYNNRNIIKQNNDNPEIFFSKIASIKDIKLMNFNRTFYFEPISFYNNSYKEITGINNISPNEVYSIFYLLKINNL